MHNMIQHEMISTPKCLTDFVHTMQHMVQVRIITLHSQQSRMDGIVAGELHFVYLQTNQGLGG